MQHLKECPWTSGQRWRPQCVPMGETSLSMREDMKAARNFNQYGQMTPKIVQPLGLEETVRHAVMHKTQAHYPSKTELIAASYMPNGWVEYEREGRPNLHASLSYIGRGCSL
ncbi:unnamed protein product, partial [Polarella glacialis]